MFCFLNRSRTQTRYSLLFASIHAPCRSGIFADQLPLSDLTACIDHKCNIQTKY